MFVNSEAHIVQLDEAKIRCAYAQHMRNTLRLALLPEPLGACVGSPNTIFHHMYIGLKIFQLTCPLSKSSIDFLYNISFLARSVCKGNSPSAGKRLSSN